MLQFNNQNGNHPLADVQMSSAYLALNGTGNSNADIFPKVSQWISDVSDSASAPNYDRTPLNSKYQGELLAAISIDGNDGAFPVAFAVVDAETEDNWHCFCRS